MMPTSLSFSNISVKERMPGKGYREVYIAPLLPSVSVPLSNGNIPHLPNYGGGL